MRIQAAMFALLGPALLLPALHADTLQMTITGTGASGTLNGTAFGPTTVTAVGTYNTANITAGSDGMCCTVYASPLSSPVEFTIGGVGTATDTVTGIAADVNGSQDLIGFVDSPTSPFLIITGSPVFNTYKLDTTLGPTFGSLYYGSGMTNHGALVLSGGSYSVAVAEVSSTPEPAPLLLVGTACLGAAGTLRRRMFAPGRQAAGRKV